MSAGVTPWRDKNAIFGELFKGGASGETVIKKISPLEKLCQVKLQPCRLPLDAARTTPKRGSPVNHYSAVLRERAEPADTGPRGEHKLPT